MSKAPVMTQFAIGSDCLEARDKWHIERIAQLERELAGLKSELLKSDILIVNLEGKLAAFDRMKGK